MYSYRLNRKDRLLYEIYEDDQTILIIRTKTHYSGFQSAEVQKLWVLGKGQEAKAKREEK
ncbi:hypothetical protein [Microcystis aeruginosa]|uniref:hypothetical protein n=1 Tax=Microcystis aeruginosa TaxID=1126 RepID=UPI003A103887